MKTKIEVDQEIDTKIGNKTESKSISNTDVSETLKSINERTENIGTSNPNIFIPTLETDFTNPDVANANKIWEIQNDITIDANCDFTNCPNVIFTDGGGKIDFATYDVTFNNAEFNFRYNDIVMDFMSATINLNSTFKSGNINVRNFGLVCDGDLLLNTGTDNANIFLQTQFIYNSTDGHATIKGNGDIMFSVVANPIANAWEPTGWYFTNGSTMDIDYGIKLGVLTNDLGGYRAITFWNSIGGYIRGGELIGDLRTHDFTVDSMSEWCHGIACGNNSKFVEIDIKIREFSGDCICMYVTSGAVYSAANSDGIIEAAFTDADGAKEYIIEADGTKTSYAGYSYSKFFDIHTPTSLIDNRQIMIYGHFSWAGVAGFKSNSFYIAYYSDVIDSVTGEYEFIERTEFVETYTIIPLKSAYKNFRIIIPTPDVWADLNGSVMSPQVPLYTKIKSKKLSYAVRNCISNISPYTIVDGIDFDDIGARFDGTTGSPAYIIDTEDFYQGLNNITVQNCTFGNAKRGIIILKGTKYFRFCNNNVKYSTDPNYPGRSFDFGNGHESMIYGNTLRDLKIELGRNDSIFSNTLYDCTVLFSLENEIFRNHNSAYNTKFSTQSTDANTVDGISTIQDCLLIYDKPLDLDAVFTHLYGGNFVWKNVVFDFGGLTFNNSTNILSTAVVNSGVQSRGSVDNFTIKNLSPETNFYSTVLQWAAQDINKMSVPFGISIRSGLPLDFTISNSDFYRFTAVLNDYPSTGAGEFTTVTVKDTIIKSPTGYSNGVAPLVVLEQKDVNFVFEDCEFAIIFELYGTRLAQWDNYGTKVFKRCSFSTLQENVVNDLNTFASNGAITFIDCHFSNITFPLRAGDVICFTKASEDMIIYASYADDAAADLAGYPKGYMYNAAGIPKIKLI